MVRGRKTSLTVQVTPAEKRVLETYERSTTISAGLYRRGRIILLLAGGASVSETARLVGVRRRNVYKWAERFLQAGPNGLWDKPGRGRISKSAMATAGMPGQFPLLTPETPQPSWSEAPVSDALAAGGR